MNRQQQFMHQALKTVHGIDQLPNDQAGMKKAFGGICHAVPGWIFANGLTGTVSYIAAKGSGESANARAYKRINAAIATILGCETEATLLDRVATEEMSRLMVDTMTLLDAWVYYKRFAVSILKVQAGEMDLASEEPEVAVAAAAPGGGA